IGSASGLSHKYDGFTYRTAYTLTPGQPPPGLEFENINSPELGVYGVDHVKVAEGLGCKAIRVTDPAELGAALEQAKKLAQEYRVPVVVEAILERVTNISMSTTNDIGNVVEFEEIATEPGHAPTSIRTLKV
ncbi:thiamine pyrophosphate-dependent enzyme, partial [Streptomyces sp. NPDC001617]